MYIKLIMDSDADGIPDIGELDDQGNCIDPIGCDNCPYVPNAPENEGEEQDGSVCGLDADPDGDGLTTLEDNCLYVSNPDQLCSDCMDPPLPGETGNACRGDEDGDGLLEADDPCPWLPSATGDHPDANADGAADECYIIPQ